MSPPKKDFYTEGEFRRPSGVYMMSTYTKRRSRPPMQCWPHGILAQGSERATRAVGLSWGDVLSAVAWAAARSPAVRADLARILAETEPGQPVSIAEEFTPAAEVSNG